MRFYEGKQLCFLRDNSPILAYSVGRLAAVMLDKLWIDKLSPAKSFVNAVPVLDSGLSQLPAKVHLFSLGQCRSSGK